MEKLVLGLYPPIIRDTDWVIEPFLVDVVEDIIPDILDFSNEQSPVVSQGKKGACAGFAGVADVEDKNMKDYDMIPAEYNDTVNFSEQMLYELARRYSGHAEGTTLDAIHHILQIEGVCRENLCPYTDDKKAPFVYTEEMRKDAAQFKVEKKYVRVTREPELKKALFKYHAFNIGVKVFDNWYKQKDGHIPAMTGMKRFKAMFGMGLLGGHAIQLVGYNSNTKEYKFKNSWATKWGDKGYGYMTKSDMEICIMDGIVKFDIDDPNELPKIKTVADVSWAEYFNSPVLRG